MVAVKNRHKVGTDEFIFDDNTIYVFAGGDKFVKFVREGESYIVETQTGNADMSVEYLYTDKYGVAILVNGKLGKYTITGIRYTFVKRVQEVSVYKYEKTPELFAKLAEFYAQKISD